MKKKKKKKIKLALPLYLLSYQACSPKSRRVLARAFQIPELYYYYFFFGEGRAFGTVGYALLVASGTYTGLILHSRSEDPSRLLVGIYSLPRTSVS